MLRPVVRGVNVAVIRTERGGQLYKPGLGSHDVFILNNSDLILISTEAAGESLLRHFLSVNQYGEVPTFPPPAAQEDEGSEKEEEEDEDSRYDIG